MRPSSAAATIPPTTEEIGRTAGRLLGQAGSSATLDALVVAQALEAGGSLILTGDLDDLRHLASDHPEIWVRPLG